MTIRRTTLGAFVTLTVAAVLIILLGPPSQAEPKKLLVSNSEAGPFRDNLATPLFEADGPFVPLDQATSTFYVKNNSGQAARATVAVVDRGSTNDFEDALTFDVRVGDTRSRGSVPSPDNPGCTLMTTGPSIQPGDVQAVDVTLAVADLQQQVGMDEAASLDFVVTLSQTGKKGKVEVCGAQAAAQPVPAGSPGNGGDARGDDGTDQQCRRDVVVTAAGSPTCVPTVVDAGASYGGEEPRDPRAVTALAVLLLGTGAGILGWTRARRRAGTVGHGS